MCKNRPFHKTAQTLHHLTPLADVSSYRIRVCIFHTKTSSTGCGTQCRTLSPNIPPRKLPSTVHRECTFIVFSILRVYRPWDAMAKKDVTRISLCFNVISIYAWTDSTTPTKAYIYYLLKVARIFGELLEYIIDLWRHEHELKRIAVVE